MGRPIRTPAKYQYFKIDKKHQDYHGIRYFRTSLMDDTVLQCLLNSGSDARRGRSNNVGVYLISKTTFFTNYLPYGYAIPCESKEFYQNCWKVMELFFPSETKKFKKRKL